MNFLVIDNFLENPEKERAVALEREYKTAEHNGINYRGISMCDDAENQARIGKLLGVTSATWTNYYRRYLADEEKETYIHSDVLLGTFTAILFLSKDSECRGGTALWKHRRTGWVANPTHEDVIAQGFEDNQGVYEGLYKDGFCEPLWEMVDYVPMAFNRLIIFSSPRFHSRYPKESFGTTLSDSRLVKVFFCKPSST